MFNSCSASLTLKLPMVWRNKVGDRFSKPSDTLGTIICVEWRWQPVEIWIATFCDVLLVGWIITCEYPSKKSNDRPHCENEQTDANDCSNPDWANSNTHA
ncbi:hypothetical protein FYZ48_10825 [Gimesia chilikensis]|uniref:hypothetical protein n=1 Tax=Gimesia chilikensis TaxID=2605989 RepID=UPI0011EC7B21|nr:hypothetical protein [Gimesia chilikensis]KAA0139130.1 hypothetical protein FYZ48_10825 [Gimesia chilikensis]